MNFRASGLIAKEFEELRTYGHVLQNKFKAN
jgi:hypothetical protein